jgi:hypothetical protein
MDQLYEFACAFLTRHPVSANMQAVGIESKVGAVDATLLYREGEFQVEMFSVPPHHIIPAHTHPNVDNIQVYVDGEIKFSHQGKFVFEVTDSMAPNDSAPFNWRMLRVKPEDRHGAIAGSSWARFISIQRWLNGIPPHCVAADYDGPVMDQAHLLLVKSGKPESKTQAELTEADAL